MTSAPFSKAQPDLSGSGLMDTLSRFPPSFDDNPWSYGFALFGLTLVSAMSLAVLAAMLLEARHNRRINARLDNYALKATGPLVTPLSLYRFKAIALLLTIAMGAAPDVLILLAWGESSDATMTLLFLLDRVCDGLVLVPFLAFVAAQALSGGAVMHRLALDPTHVDLRPRWARVRQKLQIALCAFLIAVGVTLYKAGAV